MKKPNESDGVRTVVSARLASREVVEMTYCPLRKISRFAIGLDDANSEADDVMDGNNRLVPFPADNTLIANGVVRLPSEAADYPDEAALLNEVRAFIHQYVDLSESFEAIAAHYVMFTWIYDAFREVPYLRVRGDFGSGKSRFLLTIGALCYKPIFCSGASSVSPIFRILDEFRGTLVMDEGDFRISDEMALIVKILNNGNAVGFPVLRTEVSNTKELNPRAFHVFGPKVIATRGGFTDRALESRCITEELGTSAPRSDIPLNLPSTFEDEARSIRNKLLTFRFRNVGKARPARVLDDPNVEPRIAQILSPLFATIDDVSGKAHLIALARRNSTEIATDRSLSIEAQMVEAIWHAKRRSGAIAMSHVALEFKARFGADHRRVVSPRWVSAIIRKRLGLTAYKTNGLFHISPDSMTRLEQLFRKYSVGEFDPERAMAPNRADARFTRPSRP